MWKLLRLAGGNTNKRGNKKYGESINANPLQRHSHVIVFFTGSFSTLFGGFPGQF